MDNFLAPGVFASAEAALSNSSGAYGVTIAEHIVMVALEMLRRQLDYDAIVARRGWRRDLAVRSIHQSRVTLLGTGDIGREAALRLWAFRPEGIVGVNRWRQGRKGFFDRVLPWRGALVDAVIAPDRSTGSLPCPEPRKRAACSTRRSWRCCRTGVADQRDAAARSTKRRWKRNCARAVCRRRWTCSSMSPCRKTAPVGLPQPSLTPHVAGNMTLPYTVERIVSMFLEDFENYCAGRPLKRLVAREKGY